MRTQTWMNKVRNIIAALVLATTTGCMAVGDGSPHPFTTMFQKYPPVQQQPHVFKTTCRQCTSNSVVTAIQ